MEYYYIDFKDLDIYSYVDENSPLDQANKLIENYYQTYYQARTAIHKIIDKQDNQEGYKTSTSSTLGELLDSKDETIKRNAMSILKTLNK